MFRQPGFAFFMLCFLCSCNFSGQQQGSNEKAIPGNWLILYPDHELENANQRKLYATMQDSIVNLLGLKMISINTDGSFRQTDSILGAAGKWHFNVENQDLFIRNAGQGLEFFKGKLEGVRKDTMRIVEMISAEGEQIKLTWYLKRIDDKKRISLFKKEENWWRKREASQTRQQLAEKVKAILHYYALYYEMVSKESSYFVQSRVFLPFSYYQHSMGLKGFNPDSRFSSLFHDESQARQAHGILSAAMDKVSDQSFPSGKDFVIEYAMYLKKLADAIEK